jgi:hypothetical protein
MWKRALPEDEKELLEKAIEFTGDHIKYGHAMLRVVEEWPITCEHNLTNPSINHKAFIGHCAVTLQLGIPEYITRLAWSYLKEEQRVLANKAAEIAYGRWEFLRYMSERENQLSL